MLSRLQDAERRNAELTAVCSEMRRMMEALAHDTNAIRAEVSQITAKVNSVGEENGKILQFIEQHCEEEKIVRARDSEATLLYNDKSYEVKDLLKNLMITVFKRVLSRAESLGELFERKWLSDRNNEMEQLFVELAKTAKDGIVQRTLKKVYFIGVVLFGCLRFVVLKHAVCFHHIIESFSTSRNCIRRPQSAFLSLHPSSCGRNRWGGAHWN